MLSKIKKKKKAEKQEVAFKEAAKDVAKRNRVFGDYVFDYFKACVHQHDPKCPLCKLVTSSVRDHFIRERQQKELAKFESKKRRAYMRFNILDNWAKNQSNFVEELLVGFTMDVAISGSFVKALSALRKYGVKGNLQFDSMIKGLERKRRVLEVGYFAATFIQSRVRKFITRVKLRREWLRRFEYAPETTYRGEFYMDTKGFKKHFHYPPLLRKLQERPNTPRTINRRINYEEKLAGERYERYKEAMRVYYAPLVEENQDPLSVNIWELEDNIIYSYRQLAIVRDLIEVMTQVFISQLVAKGSKVANAIIASGKKGADTSSAFNETSSILSVFKFIERENEMERIEKEKRVAEAEEKMKASEASPLNSKQIADAAAAALAAEKPSPRKLPFPCFFSFTAPAPCPRQLGMTVVVAKDSPYNDEPQSKSSTAPPSTSNSTITGRAPPSGAKVGGTRASSPPKSPGRPKPKNKNNKKDGKDGKEGEDKKDEEDEDDESDQIDYNKRLRELEQKAWDAMICVHTNDVLNKLMSEDTEPVLASAINFAMDEYGIWNGKRDMPKPKDKSSNMAYSIPSPVKEKKKEARDSEGGGGGGADEPEEVEIKPDLSTEVLPFSFQLRPYTELRGPHGLFRLFFFEGELLAISQASQFAFYNEIYQNKDSILKAIRAFASNPSVKNLIRVYIQRANPNQQQAAPSSSYSMLPPINRSPEDNVNGGQVSFFLPGENLLFNRMDHPLDMVGAAQSISKAAVDSSKTVDYENFYYSKSDMQKIKAFNYLSDKKVIELDRNYKFFSKIAYWKERVKRAITNDRNAKRTEQAAKEEEKRKKKELEEYRRASGVRDSAKMVEIDPNSLQGIFAKTKFIGESFIENYGLTKEVAEAFKKNFETFSTKTHTSIKDRMIWREADGEVPAMKYDLVAIDVMVNLRHPRDITPDFVDVFKKHDDMIKAADKIAAAEMAAKLAARPGKQQQQQQREGELDASDKDPLTVNMHQIVGIFSTENEKAPPNVDFGLYSWETFLEFRKKRNADQPISEFSKLTSSTNWSKTDPHSGLTIIRGQTPMGNEYSMKILGDSASRDYLAAELPKKVKTWIGMP